MASFWTPSIRPRPGFPVRMNLSTAFAALWRRSSKLPFAVSLMNFSPSALTVFAGIDGLGGSSPKRSSASRRRAATGGTAAGQEITQREPERNPTGFPKKPDRFQNRNLELTQQKPTLVKNLPTPVSIKAKSRNLRALRSRFPIGFPQKPGPTSTRCAERKTRRRGLIGRRNCASTNWQSCGPLAITLVTFCDAARRARGRGCFPLIAGRRSAVRAASSGTRTTWTG